MKKTIVACALTLGLEAAFAQQAATPPADKLTVRECLGILGALIALDGRNVLVAAGKPTESVQFVPYALPGKVRDAIAHNIFVLTPVQQEAQGANRRIQAEVGKGAKIDPGSVEAVELDARMSEFLDRPCKVELDHLRDSDLSLDKNDVPGSVLGALHKIRDRQ